MRIRYFAGAADAAATEEDTFQGPVSVAELCDALARRHGAEFERVLGLCSLMVDGARADDEAAVVQDAATVDVLPPFAGG